MDSNVSQKTMVEHSKFWWGYYLPEEENTCSFGQWLELIFSSHLFRCRQDYCRICDKKFPNKVPGQSSFIAHRRSQEHRVSTSRRDRITQKLKKHIFVAYLLSVCGICLSVFWDGSRPSSAESGSGIIRISHVSMKCCCPLITTALSCRFSFLRSFLQVNFCAVALLPNFVSWVEPK